MIMDKAEVAKRLYSRIEMVGECFEYQGYRNKQGYGLIGVDRGYRGTHRVSYELTHGEIPDGLLVLHSCDNPPCVRSAHLSVGTQADNARDRTERGRGSGMSFDPGWNSTKTHCPKGHPYSGDNVQYRGDGRRRCRTCNAAECQRYRDARKGVGVEG